MATNLHSSLRSYPAPYGRTCVNCSKAKCKCMIHASGQSCERCLRLNQECVRPIRKRNPRKTNKSRATRLEEKLDGLMSLLEVTAATSAQSSTQAATNPLGPPTTSTSSSIDTTSPAYDQTNVSTPLTSVSGTQSLLAAAAPSINVPWELSSEEAQAHFELFRDRKLPYFPCVHIPPSTSAAQLQAERPFLWLCIMSTCVKDANQAVAAGAKIREVIFDKMLVEFEKNIDLLLGLLVYMSWPIYLLKGRPSLSVLTQLAISAVFDLGLNRPIPKTGPASYHCARPRTGPATFTRSLEEMRAVLGCFLITSTVSIALQRIDALQWTDHMDECLRTLEDTKECEADLLLVHQVRLQRVNEQINRQHFYDSDPDKYESKIPMPGYIKALAAQLQQAQEAIPPQLSQNRALMLQYWGSSIAVHELSLLKTPNSDYRRIQHLFTTLQSIQSWLETYNLFSARDSINFPFVVFSHMPHTIQTLFKLNTFEDPAWDKEFVRHTLDVLVVGEQILQRMEQGVELITSEIGDRPKTFLARGLKSMRYIQTEWVAKLEPKTTEHAMNIDSVEAQLPLPDDLLGPIDDDWLMGLFPS